MSPKLETLKAALKRLDDNPWGRDHAEAAAALQAAAKAAGYDPKRAIADWARYQIAVGEAADQVAEPVEHERDPETREMFA